MHKKMKKLTLSAALGYLFTSLIAVTVLIPISPSQILLSLHLL